jgi:ferredoxin-NADP reductase
MPLVKKYIAEVISVLNTVENIYTVELRSLSGRFKYLPGQFLHMALDEYDPSFGWPESRCFSMQSSPVQECIKITFSVKGSFTSRMASELIMGKIVSLKLPYGELFQNECSKQNVVFIAGGTGITPFLSLFHDPTFVEFKSPRLYFGVRKNTYNIYNNDFDMALKINPNLNIEFKYQDVDGLIDIERIYTENGTKSIYFISGPQLMISSFKSRLLDLGVSDNFVKTDEWE